MMLMKLMAHGNPPTHFMFPSLTRLGVPHVTTSRHCGGIGVSGSGGSPFTGPAIDVLERAGLPAGRVAWARQVHGADVARVGVGGGFAGHVDVLATDIRSVPLAIFTADCLAII